MNNLLMLKEPIPITEHVWDENTIPLVSIGCLTYNHELYIRDAIEGFLMQKTTFPVKIVVFEDCSTDKTASIIKEYEEKNPNLFTVFNQPVNTWGKPIRKEAKKVYENEKNKAKYIALCEGDDYWTDPLKLQKQVDFLEENSDFSFSFHDALVIQGNSGKQQPRIGNRKINETVDLKSVIIQNNFPTASLVYRTSAYNAISEKTLKTSKGDYTLVIRLAE